MKSQIMFAVLAFVVGTTASATGLKRTIYNCRAGTGEAAASVRLDHITITAPGRITAQYLTGQASHSWFGGTHHTGVVTVTAAEAQDGGPTTYVNVEKKFALTVHDVEYVGRSLIVKRIDVSGDFVAENTGWPFSIPRQWLECQR